MAMAEGVCQLRSKNSSGSAKVIGELQNTGEGDWLFDYQNQTPQHLFPEAGLENTKCINLQDSVGQVHQKSHCLQNKQKRYLAYE